jgi:hypothetical protein
MALRRVFPSDQLRWEPELVYLKRPVWFRAKGGAYLFEFAGQKDSGMNARDKARMAFKQRAAQAHGLRLVLIKRGGAAEMEVEIRYALRRALYVGPT